MPPAIPPPYERTQFRGVLLDYATAAACVVVEGDLGYRLTLLQGVGGAEASAGTHLGRRNAAGVWEGGRAVDLAPYDGARKVRSWRTLVGPGWERDALPGVWGPHVHCLNRFEALFNERGLAPAAVDQLHKFDRGEDGLADPPTPDPDKFRPDPRVVFTLDRYKQVMRDVGLDGGPLETPVTRARDALVESDADLGRAAALLRVLPTDAAGREELDNIQRDRVRIRATLERMPKR